VIVDGKKIAHEIVEELFARRSTLPPVLRIGVVMGGEDAASASFVKIKERVADKLKVVVVRELLNGASTTIQALRALGRLAKSTEGVIVQLPLPKHIDTNTVLAAIPASHDLDAVNPTATHPLVQAPVAEAIGEILSRYNISAQNKNAVVVGAGRLVGAPAAALLRDVGAHVSVVTHGRGSLDELKSADILVLGTGNPGIIKPEMLKEDVVLIDAGTSEDSGRLAGDASPECAEVASVFTPVPGGVGPIAVAMIFKNLFDLVGRT